MANLQARLDLARNTIRETCRISSTPGFSVGVMHEKKIVCTFSLGFRDMEKKISPDKNTIYYLASLGKSFTVAAVADLVERSKMDWNATVKDVFSEFTHHDPAIKNESTLLD